MYEVGTYVDLSYLNKKHEVVAAAPRKKSAYKKALEAASNLQEVGTQYVFDQTTGKFGKRIQVQFA
jgi:hypothetical protein